MFSRLDSTVIDRCRQAAAQGEVIEHHTARQIADAYAWSWVTCWFAGTGQIGHPIMGPQFQADPVTRLQHALFGWWLLSDDNRDGSAYAPGEQDVVTAMHLYLSDRVARGDTGPVTGWAQH
jgi:hypothetical protein